jgi:cbb3-type cytochrome oxidase subunit 3
MKLAQLRPATPVHLAAVGALAWLIATAFHPLAVLAPIGLALLLIAAVGWLLRPRTRTTYWRGRPIDLTDDAPTFGHRLYYTVFRH